MEHFQNKKGFYASIQKNWPGKITVKFLFKTPTLGFELQLTQYQP
jgi:hypothetical protein